MIEVEVIREAFGERSTTNKEGGKDVKEEKKKNNNNNNPEENETGNDAKWPVKIR